MQFLPEPLHPHVTSQARSDLRCVRRTGNPDSLAARFLTFSALCDKGSKPAGPPGFPRVESFLGSRVRTEGGPLQVEMAPKGIMLACEMRHGLGVLSTRFPRLSGAGLRLLSSQLGKIIRCLLSLRPADGADETLCLLSSLVSVSIAVAQISD